MTEYYDGRMVVWAVAFVVSTIFMPLAMFAVSTAPLLLVVALFVWMLAAHEVCHKTREMLRTATVMLRHYGIKREKTVRTVRKRVFGFINASIFLAFFTLLFSPFVSESVAFFVLVMSFATASAVEMALAVRAIKRMVRITEGALLAVSNP